MSRDSFEPTPLLSVSDSDASALAGSIGVETAELFARLDASRELAGIAAGAAGGPRSCGVDC